MIPIGIFYLIWLFFFRRFAERQGLGGLMAIGKSRAKVYVEKDTKTTFKDVAGVEEAKGDLTEVVAFLKNPKCYGRLGSHLPKGILLVGPPGTGKTLLARDRDSSQSSPRHGDPRAIVSLAPAILRPGLAVKYRDEAYR